MERTYGCFGNPEFFAKVVKSYPKITIGKILTTLTEVEAKFPFQFGMEKECTTIQQYFSFLPLRSPQENLCENFRLKRRGSTAAKIPRT